MADHPWTTEIIRDEGELRALLGFPKPIVASKMIDRLNPLTRQFIERSPMVCIATSDARGNCDASPRGDPAGFVRILDDTTLLLPERPGNKIADTLRNILQNPHVGLLFLLPGIGDTFRVNGRATLTTDADLLEPSTVNGRRPELGILIDVDEAYPQCSKAFIRSALWDPEHYQRRTDLPSSGEIMRAIRDGDFDAETYDRERAERYARGEGLY